MCCGASAGTASGPASTRLARTDQPLHAGQSVVVVGMADGIATVVPVDMKLLEKRG
ncbi:hypothetical protein [Candidatus Palauibacter sp.]|uniref:hypothetical protein n=1 Tax=Candidatus Palauibacter sp. TaxID=3101350 RepID=UPI003AF1FDD1